MIKQLFSIILAVLGLLTPDAYSQESRYRFHCERDTVQINEMLTKMNDVVGKPIDRRILAAAALLEGRPYVAHTLEGGDSEQVVINVDQLDCVTFVETCFCLARCTERPGATWRDFANALENIRYRRGECTGRYESRLHYTADWINDNVYRGNVKEITPSIPGALSFTKTLNFMTRNRDLYPALADSATYEACREIEYGFFSLKIPYLKKESSRQKEVIECLRDGDMLSFLTKVDGLDSSHVALIRIVDGKPYLMHASMKRGKVTFEQRPLSDYFKYEKKDAKGYRVVRLCD